MGTGNQAGSPLDDLLHERPHICRDFHGRVRHPVRQFTQSESMAMIPRPRSVTTTVRLAKPWILSSGNLGAIGSLLVAFENMDLMTLGNLAFGLLSLAALPMDPSRRL